MKILGTCVVVFLIIAGVFWVYDNIINRNDKTVDPTNEKDNDIAE